MKLYEVRFTYADYGEDEEPMMYSHTVEAETVDEAMEKTYEKYSPIEEIFDVELIKENI